MAPRLVALDVDGTLLTSRHEVTEATVAALTRVRAAGVEVLLTTSRGPRALEPVLQRTGLLAPAAFVGSQGGITGCLGDDGLRVLDRRPASLAGARQLVRDALAAGLSVHWYAGEHWFVSHLDRTVEAEIAVVRTEPEVRDLLAEQTPPEKLMLIAPPTDLAPLRAVSASLPADLQAQPSNPTYLEITRRGVDKGSAVAAYCLRRGIPAAGVVAIGDGPNDLGLFAFAGTSVAPANARAEVLAAATLVTASNDDEGVARALATLLP